MTRALRFAAVGAGVACAYVLLYVVFLGLGMAQVAANGLAFCLAICLQYVGQARYTFGVGVKDGAQMARFGIMVALGFLVSALVTGYAAPMFGMPDWSAAAAVALLLPVQNFILMTLWVFVADRKLGGRPT